MYQPILLIQGINNQLVEGILCDVTQKHHEDFKTLCQPQLQQFGAVDRDWDWDFKARVYGSLPGAELYAIECGALTQGLMLMTAAGHRSWFKPASRIVYVQYLASAPWNRPEIQNPPTYKAVGGRLLDFARARSLELGYKGRVGLHSIPQAEGFYRKAGMIEVGADPENDNLVYFEWYRSSEVTSEDADRWS